MKPVTSGLAQMMCRAYPFLSGFGRIASTRLLAKLAPSSPGLAKTRWGDLVAVNPMDYVGRTIYYFGDLDPKVSLFLSALVREGDVVIDIGANIGVVTTLAARLVGESGHVHAFEPQHRVFEDLKKTVASNSYDRRVSLHEVAISNDNADMVMENSDPSNTGMAKLASSSKDQGGRDIVRVVRGDEFLAEKLEGKRIRLVKIDVEGHELMVLEGLALTLETNPPHAILIECNDRPFSLDGAPSLAFLHQAGYDLYLIAQTMFTPKLIQIRKDAVVDVAGHDVLAIVRGSRGQDVHDALGAMPRLEIVTAQK